ncbi:MAG: hypothetical protein M3209_06205 [Acidobacteriota bacterium]|nr:hypothetical protein [Acidobacteriota bacterium]
MEKLKKLLHEPHPFRTLAKEALKRLELGSYEQRFQLGAIERPHYAYGVYNAASLAQKLGYPRISVLEFGVAGGNGLLNLEYHSREASKLFGTQIDVYGFDTGEGLPEPVDYRDLPYKWKQGFFKMDVPALKAKLKNSTLVLGDVRHTADTFFEEYKPAPIGFISYDLDFYSSTVAAMKMLEAGDEHYLPRLFCYFDDTVGTESELYNDFTGQRLAINEFNQNHETIKLSRPYYLLAKKTVEPWFHQIWICHFFNHPDYSKFVSEENQQLVLRKQ